jgi:hypothetical protein
MKILQLSDSQRQIIQGYALQVAQKRNELKAVEALADGALTLCYVDWDPKTCNYNSATGVITDNSATVGSENTGDSQ